MLNELRECKRNYESIVEGANEDELGVGGKLDK